MRITLKKKKLKTRKYSLYIEYYKYLGIDNNGTQKHYRKTEYLSKYLIIEPKNEIERIKNRENLCFAQEVLKYRMKQLDELTLLMLRKNLGKLNLKDIHKKIEKEMIIKFNLH